MHSTKTVIFITLFAAIFTINVGARVCDNNLSATESLSTKEIPLLKTFVDPIVIKKYVEQNFAPYATVETEIINVGVNDIYLVVIGTEKYVLRLSRADKNLTLTDSSFLFELTWLEYLNDHHVPISFPIRRIDQQLFGIIDAFEGPRYATLFSYAEGTTDINAEQAFILGRSLAHLHVVSDDFITELEHENLDVDQLIDQPLKQLKDTLDSSWENELQFLDQLTEKLKKQISKIGKLNGAYGIIAGDIHGSNQHFTTDNQLTMFDFEFCAYGYRVYDIATFRWGQGSDIDLWNAFLNGYQSCRKLNPTELESIDHFVLARNLWWMSSISKMPEYQNEIDDEFWEFAFSQFHRQ